MTIQLKPISAFIALAGFSLILCACRSDKHAIIEAKPGMTVVCTLCYDEVAKLELKFPHPGVIPPTGSVHQCPACRTEVSTYVENGVAKVKCAVCAPQGLDCDKCFPVQSIQK